MTIVVPGWLAALLLIVVGAPMAFALVFAAGVANELRHMMRRRR